MDFKQKYQKDPGMNRVKELKLVFFVLNKVKNGQKRQYNRPKRARNVRKRKK